MAKRRIHGRRPVFESFVQGQGRQFYESFPNLSKAERRGWRGGKHRRDRRTVKRQLTHVISAHDRRARILKSPIHTSFRRRARRSMRPAIRSSRPSARRAWRGWADFRARAGAEQRRERRRLDERERARERAPLAALGRKAAAAAGQKSSAAPRRRSAGRSGKLLQQPMREPAFLDAQQSLGADRPGEPARRRERGVFDLPRRQGASQAAGRLGAGGAGRRRRGRRARLAEPQHRLSRVPPARGLLQMRREAFAIRLAQQSAGRIARAFVAGDDEPLRRARHRDIEQAAVLAGGRLARRGAPAAISALSSAARAPRRTTAASPDAAAGAAAISDRAGRSARRAVSGRNTIGASSPLAACTVITRTASPAASMSRLICEVRGLDLGEEAASDGASPCSCARARARNSSIASPASGRAGRPARAGRRRRRAAWRRSRTAAPPRAPRHAATCARASAKREAGERRRRASRAAAAPAASALRRRGRSAAISARAASARSSSGCSAARAAAQRSSTAIWRPSVSRSAPAAAMLARRSARISASKSGPRERTRIRMSPGADRAQRAVVGIDDALGRARRDPARDDAGDAVGERVGGVRALLRIERQRPSRRARAAGSAVIGGQTSTTPGRLSRIGGCGSAVGLAGADALPDLGRPRTPCRRRRARPAPSGTKGEPHVGEGALGPARAGVAKKRRIASNRCGAAPWNEKIDCFSSPTAKKRARRAAPRRRR